MDDNFQDVRVPGNAGTGDTTQRSASVSFGQVIPNSVPNPSVAQPFPTASQPIAPASTPVAAPIPTPAPTPTPAAAPITVPIEVPVPSSQSSTQPGFTQTPVEPPTIKPVVPRGPKLNFNWKKIAKIGGIIAVVLLILGGIAAVAITFMNKRNEGQVLNSSKFNTVQIPLDDLATGDGDVALLGTRSLVINGPLRANSAFIISPSAQPSNAARGQIYYDQNSNQMAYFNGSRFVPLSDTTNVVQNIAGFAGQITLGQGLAGANGQITNSGVLTVQGQTGNVTFVGGPGIAVDGTTITNSGVTSFGGRTGDVTVGTGLTITPAGELQNSGIIGATGGSGISVTNDGNGNITISNTGAGTGTVQSPGGTTGRIAKFTGVQTLEDSLLSESGTTVTVNGNLSVAGGLTLSSALTVGNGGTGATALANNGVVIGQGTGALTAVTAGGAGLCFMSTGGAPAFQACPGGASVTSVNGLTGALNIANATGAGTTITINDASTSQKGIAQFNATNFTAASGVINTTQNIHVAATPTFGALTLTSSQATNPMLFVNNTNGGATGNLVDIQLNGASRLALSPAGNMTVTGTINGQTISSAASFSGSLNVATNVTAGGDLAVNGGDITSTGALNITPGGALAVGAAAQSLTLQGNGTTTLSATNAGNTTTVSFQSPTANVNYRLLTAAAGTYDICTTAGNCVGIGGGVTTSGGTTNQIPKFTGSNTIGDSLISDNGSTVSIAGALAVSTITPTGAMTIGATAQNLTLQGASTSLSSTSGGVTNTLAFATPSGSNKTITIPNASGTVAVSASGPLALDAAGNLTCATCVTAGSVVTSLNGLTGALSIANASGAGSTITIQDASTAQKGIAQFNSTNFTTAAGVVNTIQNIHVTATPTFGTLTLTSSQATSPMLLVNNTNVSGTGNLIDLQLNGASRLAVTPAGNLTLTGTVNGQTISSAASFSGTLAVAGTASLNGGASVTGTLNANTITPTGAMTVGATSQSISLQGNASSTFAATSGANTTTFSFQTPTANVTYRLLTAAAGTYDLCTTAGNCVGIGGGVTTTGGTTNQLAKFSGSNSIADSIISDNGTTVSVGGVLAVNTITPTGAMTIGATGQNLLLQGATTSLTSTNGGITNALTFATPSGSNKTITIPNATGTVAVSASGPIVLDAAGNISCPTCSLSGSGVTSLNGLTGALSIANASGSGSTVTIQDASTSQKGIAQFNSTNFSAASGVVNTIQNISVAATPTFGALTLTSSQATSPMLLVNNTNASGTGNLIDLQLNGASRLSVSPAGNMTVTGTINGQTISSAASFSGSLAVAGAANLNGGASVTGTLNANTITPTAAMTVGATGQSLTLQGNASSTFAATNGANTTTFSFQTPTANVTYRLLTAAAGTYDICTTAGNCAGVGGGVTTSGGTTNQLAKFTGSSTIGDSLISDNGSTVTIGGVLAVNTITPTGALTIGATGQNLLLQGATTSVTATDGGITNSLTFATPSGSNKTITIPNATGTVAVSASGPITLDAAGNIACPTCALAGSGVTSLNGLTGALSIANASGTGSTITIQDASTAQKGIAQFNSTNFSAASGVINTIQNISVTATPTFGTLTLTSSQATSPMLLVNNTNASGTGNLIDLQLNGASRLSVSPAGNMTVTGTVNGQTISSAASLTGTLAVAGAASLNGGATVTGTLTANTITPSGAMTIGATGQSLTLQGNASSTLSATNGANTTTLSFQTPTANVTYRLLTAAAGTYDICTTAGNCAGVGGGVTTAGGTTNQLAKFTGASSIGDSLISDNGSTVTIGGVLAVNTITPTGALTIGAIGQNLLLQGATTSLTATNAGVTNSLSFTTPSGSGKTITLPNASGTVAVSASGPITLDAAGNIACPTCALTGSGVTSLNGLTGALAVANATGSGSTITIQDASTGQKGLAQFNSTNFTAASGVINTIQDIDVTAAPTFGRLTVTSSQASNGMLLINNTNTGATGNLIDLQLNGASRLSVSPAGNMTLTGTINGQTISSAANLTGTLAVAGAANLNGGATVTGTLTANTITPTGALTVGATNQSFLLQGNSSSTISATNGANTTTVSFQTPTANVTYRLLTAAAGTYDICTTAGNCAGVGGGVTTPGGTTGAIAKFSGSGTIVDSIITESGSTITIGGSLAVNTITPAAAMTIGATGQNLTLQGATTSVTATSGGITNTLTFATPSASNKTITIPNATGTVAVSASGPLAIDAAGNITCATCVTSGGGGGGVGAVDSLNGLTGALTLANASGSGSTVTIDDASTSQKGIAQFNSTNFSAASGVINTIQDINTSATPTFGRLTVTSSQASNGMFLVNNTNGSGTGNLIDLQLNGSSRMSVSPAGAMTLVGALNGQTISSAANFTGTLAVAGLASLNGGATVTGTLTANNLTPTGALTVGATSQSFLLQGSAGSTITATNGANTTTIGFQTPSANVTYRFLTAAAGTYDVCTTVGNCAGVGGGVTTAGGTTNQLAKFTGSSTIGNSIISDNGSTVTIGGTLAVNTLTPTAALSIGATGQNLTLQGASVNLTSTSGGITNALTFATPSGSNKTVTVPNASGTLVVSASGPLAIDAAGNITCATCATGANVSSLNGLTGALSIANATGSGSTITINDASTSQKGIAQFNSTNFSAASGVINTIQDINTGATPTFGRLTVTSSQASNGMFLVNNTNASGTGNLIDLQLNGSSRMSVNPAGAMTLVGALNGQTISSAANFTGTLAVAGLASLNGGATVTGTLTANNLTPTGALTVGATSQSFLLQGSSGSTITATSGANTTTVSFQAPTANVTYRFLTAAAGTYDVCTTLGNCAGVGGGVTTPGGTAGTIAKFTASGTIGDSLITESGSTVTIGGTLAVNTLTPTAALTVGATAQDLTLQGAVVNLRSTASGITNTLAFATPSSSNKTITIPNASGTLVVSASGPLAIDAAGNITCATCATGTTVSSLNGLTGALSIANASGSGSTVTINDASTSQKGIAQFNSTNFSAASGVINTIQNINSTAAPTFGQLTLTSSQASAAMLTVNNTNVSATGNLIDLQLNGASRMSVSPAGAMTVASTINGQTISSAASFTGSLAVAGAANLNGGASVTGTLNANTITPTGTLTVGATSQSFLLQGSASSTITATNGANTTTVAFQTPTANVTYRLLTAAAGTYDVCTTVGNCAGVGGGVTTAGGTVGTIAKFTASGAIGDSILTESGTTITVGGTLAATTALQTPLLDTASAAALNIGTTNATAINLNQNTNVTGNFDVSGTLTAGTGNAFQVAANGTLTTAGSGTFQGGTLTVGTTAQAGSLVISDGSSNTATISVTALSVDRAISFGDEAGTVCLQNSTNCGFAAASGSNNYIQNQNSIDQTTANFRISGTGRANTSLLTPLLDTPSAGTLTLGGTATAIALNEDTTVTGNLTQNTGTISLTGNAASSITTSAGALTLTGAAASVWSTSAGDLTLQAATTNTLNLQTGGAGTVALGDQNTTTINIGRGSNIARTINIGDTSGGSAAQTVNVGNTGSSSVTTIKGGGGVTINAASGAWSLQGASTSTLAGTNGSFTTTFGFTTPTANTTINLPALTAGTYTVCTSSGNCAGAGVTLQSAYNNSTNPELTLDATRGALTVRDNASALGANLLEVQNNAGSTTYFAVSATGTSTTGTATVTGNINSSGGALQTNGTTRIDNSGNATNIGSITLSGAISGGTTYSGSGNINTTGGALQTNSTNRVDNSGNLVNIGNITGTGAVTIASSGAGNDIIINGADILDIQDATTFAGTATFNGVATFNTDVNLTLAETENLEITNTVTGSNAVDLFSGILTNNSTSGTQRVGVLQNAAGTGTTEALLLLDNADTDTAVVAGLQITSAAGAITTGIDLTDPDIVNALSVSANHIVGTTGNIDFTNFDVVGTNGNTTIGGLLQVATLGTADTLTQLCRNTANQLATCATTGTGAAFVQGGNSFGATAVLGTNDAFGLNLEVNNVAVVAISSSGAVNFANAANSTSAFNIENQFGDNLLTVDTTNSRVGINLGANNTPSMTTNGLEVKGAIRISGSGGILDTYTTPQGTSVATKLNIVNDDPGSFGQLFAAGLTSTAQSTARGFSLFDARTFAHQQTFAIFNPDESSTIGMSWNGTNHTGYVSTLDVGGADSKNIMVTSGAVTAGNGTSGDLTLQSGDITGGTSQTTGDVVMRTGNGSGTNASSGSIQIDTGTKTGSGTIGAINIGTTNASGINIGNTSGALVINNSNLLLNSAGVLTMLGGQTRDITTADASTATALTFQPGTSSGASSNGPAMTVKGGDASGTTAVVGGALVLQGGSATGGSGTRTGGDVNLDAGTGATANGSINIGTVNTSTINVGRTTGSGTLNIGRSADTYTLNIAGTAPTSTSTQTINIANTTQSSASTIDLNILSGGAGTNGTATVKIANYDRVNQVDIGNVVADTARTLNLFTGNSTAVDTINIGTGNTTAAGGKTINIGTGTPSGSGSNLITIGSTALASATTIQSGTGNIILQAAGAGTIGRIQIGAGGAGSTTPDYFALDVKSDTGDPAGGAEGYMYYNTFDNKFRCFQGAAWTDCITTSISTSLQTAYNNGATIETASNVPVLITETTTGANTGDLLQLTSNVATGGTHSGDLLQLTMDAVDANAYTGNAIHVVIDQSQSTGDAILVEDDGGADLFRVDETGAVSTSALRPITNGTTALQVQNASGSSTALVVDTTNLRVGIGAGTAPAETLDVTGTAKATVMRTGPKVVERTFDVTFPNGVANQKFDLYFSSFWGQMNVNLVSDYADQIAAGSIEKTFYLGLLPGNSILTNAARYTESSGATPANFAISDVTWDAANSRYRVQIVHRVSTGNGARITIKAYASETASADEIARNMAASSIYTTDATAFTTPTVSFTGNVGIGVSDAGAYRLNVQGGDINTSGNLATSNTTRIDSSGNLTNIGNLTGTGAITIASSGAGNDITINGADELIVQDASVFNALATFNTDVNLTLAETENLSLTNTVTGSNAVDLLSSVLTNNSTSGIQRIGFLQNAAGTGTTESLLTLDNADTDTAVVAGLQITSAAGAITTAIDLSDADIVDAINVGANNIVGTTGNIDLTNFDVVGASGNTTIGGTLGVTGNAAFDTNTLFVDATNNRVGFSTSSPTATLHLNGTYRDQYTAMWQSSTGNFTAAANQVAYLELGDVSWSGSMDVTIAGGWGSGQAFGNITKRFSFFHAAGAGSISNSNTDVPVAMGKIAENYAIGDIEVNGTALRIPIYQLSPTFSNTLSITVNMLNSTSAQINNQLAALTTTAPATVANSATRNHVSFGNSNVGIGTATPTAALDIRQTVTGSTSLDLQNAVITNNSSSGTQRGIVVQNAAGTGTTESLLTLDNADTDTAVVAGLQITSAAGAITTAIDLSDADIVDAMNVGANNIVGTTGNIDLTNFDVVGSSGNTTIGGTLNVTGNATFDTNTLFVDAANNRVGIGTASPSTALTVNGEINTTSFSGAGLTDCDASNSKLLWDSSTNQFSCGTDRASFTVRKASDETVTTSTTHQSDNDFTFSIGANEIWAFQIYAAIGSSAFADWKGQIIAPSGATCRTEYNNLYNVINASTTTCGTTSGSMDHADSNDHQYIMYGTVANGATAGNVTLQWAQGTSSGSTIMRAGSHMVAYKINGADLAEAYYTNDSSIGPGDIVKIDGSLKAGVQKTNKQYDTGAIGIVSTKPGFILGDDVPATGKPVLLALAGRIPVKVSSENGDIQPGDYLTTSSVPGVAMKATGPGQVIGKALEAYSGSNTHAQGTVMVFANLSYYPGEASLQSAEASLLTLDQSTNPTLAAATPANMTDSVTELQGTVKKQQEQLDGLQNRVATLEAMLGKATDEVTIKTLKAEDVTAAGTLTVTGKSQFADVTINGKLDVGLLNILGSDASADANPAAAINTKTGTLKLQSLGLNGVEIMNGKVVVDTSGNMTVNATLTAKKINIDASDAASAAIGEATLVAGKTKVEIKTTAVTEHSKIFVTPKSTTLFPLSVTIKKAGDSFTVESSAPTGKDVTFDWWITN